MQARDAALCIAKAALPKSDVNREFATEQISRDLEGNYVNGNQNLLDLQQPHNILQKLIRRGPYYDKNKASICTFWLRNACSRSDCPYRPCNGDTNLPELSSTPELRNQNIKDRYYGIIVMLCIVRVQTVFLSILMNLNSIPLMIFCTFFLCDDHIFLRFPLLKA